MKLINITFIIFGLIILNACKTEIDVTGPWKENAAIYGLLNPNDSVHYIRIHRAYLDSQRSALEITQIEDSIYFDSLDIMAYAYSNNYIIDSFGLNRSILNNKDSGMFKYPEQAVYSFHKMLNSDYKYHFKINNPTTGYQASASTQIIESDVYVLRPGELSKINFVSDKVHKVDFRLPKYAFDIEIYVELFFTETIGATSNTDSIKVQLYRLTNTEFDAGEIINVEYPGKSFYSTLKNQIKEVPNIKRSADSIQYHFYFRGEHLSNYIRASYAQSGISGSQALLEYSNVENGNGIVSSVTEKHIYSKELAPIFKDSLACSYLTKKLNFLDRNDLLSCP
tara:strand:+ start:128 stop:1141 length:1014 start_codon:yes stop_codon:yes gene_type:complete